MVAPFEKFDLTGKTALVTGGSAGLGFCMARALGRAGANVLIVARREEVLKKAADELLADPHINDISCRTADMADRDSVNELAEYTNSTYGGVDIYVGNAAGTFSEPLTELKLETFDEAIQSNVTSNIQLANAFLPGMQQKKWGRVIFSSSIASILAAPNQANAAYSTTKGAVNAFCRSIAGDMGHFNITANALVLGFFLTDIVTGAIQQITEEQSAEAAKAFINDFASSTALGRIGDPAEVEGLVQLLASDAGSYITGSSICIDGGMSIMMRPLPVS